MAAEKTPSEVQGLKPEVRSTLWAFYITSYRDGEVRACLGVCVRVCRYQSIKVYHDVECKNQLLVFTPQNPEAQILISILFLLFFLFQNICQDLQTLKMIK